MGWSRVSDLLSRQHLHPTTTEHDQPTRRMFELARGDIVTLLAQHSTLQAVGLIRRGHHYEADFNRLVVLVTGKLPDDEWLRVQASIRRLLTRHDAAIASVVPIELFHAEVTTLATSSDPVPLGASLSVSKLPWARGSLGGYVCLSLDENSTLKDDPRRCWVAGVYALTCHHVLRPTRPPGVEVPEGVYDEALNAVDISHPAVSSPTGPPFHRSLPVQQPDPKREQVRVEAAMKVRESLLQKVQQTRAEQSMDEDDRRTRYQKKIDLLERHLECCNAELERHPGYGHVFATSGYRVDVTPLDGFAHGCTIDWGLIDVDQSRRAVNELPPLPFSETAFAEMSVPSPERPRLLETADITKGMVAKCGSTTGTTYGMISADAFSLFNLKGHHGKASVEQIILDSNAALHGSPPFCRPGDSGAWVFDPQGRVVGMVVEHALGPAVRREGALDMADQPKMESWQYVTPIRSIFRDIERVTGCQVKLLGAYLDD